MSLDKALPFVLRMECPGGNRAKCFSNHADDPGGPTNQGVIQRVYDNFRKDRQLPVQSVKDITDAEVETIYAERYWVRGGCMDMPWPISLAHFDACVNTGVERAIKILQKTLNLEPDGVIGPKTLMKINAAAAESRVRILFDELLLQRIWFYNMLIREGKVGMRWLPIWLERCRALQMEAYPK